MAVITSKIEKLELMNGETVELTLNYARLLYLRSNGYEKEIARAMKTISGKGDIDMLETPYLYYAAYLCANNEPKYTQEEFIALIPFDLAENANLYANIISKKKVEISKMRSSAARQKAK